MNPDDVADFSNAPRSDSIVIERPKDAVYVAIGRHVFKPDVVVIWTGLLGWVPLADAIPAQLIDIKQADQLRGAMTDKWKINVIRLVPPTGKGSVTIQ